MLLVTPNMLSRVACVGRNKIINQWPSLSLRRNVLSEGSPWEIAPKWVSSIPDNLYLHVMNVHQLIFTWCYSRQMETKFYLSAVPCDHMNRSDSWLCSSGVRWWERNERNGKAFTVIWFSYGVSWNEGKRPKSRDSEAWFPLVMIPHSQNKWAGLGESQGTQWLTTTEPRASDWPRLTMQVPRNTAQPFWAIWSPNGFQRACDTYSVYHLGSWTLGVTLKYRRGKDAQLDRKPSSRVYYKAFYI